MVSKCWCGFWDKAKDHDCRRFAPSMAGCEKCAECGELLPFGGLELEGVAEGKGYVTGPFCTECYREVQSERT